MENLLFFRINPEGESLSIRNTRNHGLAFSFASINIDITIFAMRFNNSPTIRFVRTVSHRVIHRTWNSFARENCPLTENPEGFFSFSFLLFSLFFFFRSSFSRKKRGKRTRNIFQCERKSEQYRVKRIGK